MIFDRTLLFSNAQAITATAASTDIVDLMTTGAAYGHDAALVRDLGTGQGIPLLIQAVEDFNTLTSLTVTVQVDDNSGFSSAKDVMSTTIALANLKAGRTFAITVIPPGANERYMRINYTVTGSNPSAGKITAGVVAGVQTNAVGF